MRGQHLDVLMALATIEVVFDAEVWKVNLVVEVRQLVFLCPLRDLSRVPIRPSIAVRSISVVLLQERLVIAFQLLLEHDPPNLGALVSKLLLGPLMRPIELGVVIELARPVHAHVDREHPAVFAVQLVDAIAVEDQLSFEAAWQVEIGEQRVTRIVAALARVPVNLAIEFTESVLIARVAPTWIGVVEHRSLQREKDDLSRRPVSNGD
jgi:hypothetical protein